MVDRCRVSKYYPNNYPIDGNIKFIATLDNRNPVNVYWNHFATDYGGLTALNLYDIVDLYNTHITPNEDWYVAYSAGLSFEEDIRNRNIRKYTKALVVEILERLCHHKIIDEYAWKDIFVNSYEGEIRSFFRPYKTIHVTKARNSIW